MPKKLSGYKISISAAKPDERLRQGWRFYPELLMPNPSFKLSDVADVRSGYTFRGALEHDPAGDIRVLQIKDLRQSSAIEPDTLTAISWDARTSPPLLQSGDIAVIARGDNNKAALFTGQQPVVATSQFFIVSTKKQDVLPEYLCWLINLPQSQRSLERSGSAIQAISKASLLDMRIPLPPLATQQKLIALQALWDEEDELIARLQTNREQMLQGIYQHLIKD
ncbi:MULTISPECIES: restriction endonuclease subunit S [Pseudomonas]|jgi:restriction endonuclease S subunit|uniref:Restriction endonuclease subunit S n=1 Tax=Pseudomonas aeruginosa TaxID=287 RepID=A0AAQ3QZU4_PSEAI|nr:restriction endonuclease subunit S [Pseudomonas aeruginosa]MCA4068089.1 restriction endonuclease subunit S [Pseudomonas aeruginosa]MCC0545198.1 restriction endonuclease subunit S [Pseudomonas aeruginosa]MCE2642867.1 restriction endonuclease subunit S [Pseudomonas aeruginosa]MCF3977019.1 restriction endonuclease subunit S [Pseudomonas aeruginosa]MCK1052411.1 restriction endonuclease subunit S [Pseudomonas aeruginosa]